MQTKSRKAISRLSRRSFLASKKQNSITILAIILTTVLFTSLFTVFFSISRSFERQEQKMIGYSADIMVKYVDEDETEAVRNSGVVKDVGSFISVGTAKVPSELTIISADEQSAKYSFLTPVKGNLPKASDEIVIAEDILKALNAEPEVGSKIDLTFEVETARGTGEITDTFVVSGVAEKGVSYVGVSDSYARDLFASVDEDLRSHSFLFCNSNRLDVFSAAIDLSDIIKNDRIITNPINDRGDTGIDMDSLVAIGIFLVLIATTGFLIIYNIFQITAGNKTRNYGLLKTIGVTSKQLRKIMYGETRLLCLIGIPVGLLIGYLIGNSLVPQVIASTTYAGATAVSGFSPLIFIISALFTLITVFISASIPVRKASKVSPIEALRYTDAKTSSRPHTSNRTKITNMASANLGRNKTRTVMVLMSLALALVLFDSLCIFTSNIDPNEYIQASSPSMDFVVSTNSCFTGENDSFLSDAEIQTVKDNIDSKVAGTAYTTKDLVHIDGNLDKPTIVIGVDDTLASQMYAIEGDLDNVFEEGKLTAAVPKNSAYKVGDKVKLAVTKEYLLKNKKTGNVIKPEELAYDDDFNNYELLTEGTECEFTVGAIIEEIPSSFNVKFSYQGSNETFIISRPSIATLTENDFVNLFFCADAKDTAAYDAAEKYLSELKSTNSHYDYTSLATVRAEFDEFTGMAKLIGTIICAIVGMIGVLNFLNAIYTGILSRKREFALLKAVGMTTGQLRRMIITEGLFYSILSIIITIPGAAIMNILFNNIELFWLATNRHLIIWPLLIVLPIFILMSFLIPLIVYGNVQGKSIVEDLRTNE